jgi:hypothetical protein
MTPLFAQSPFEVIPGWLALVVVVGVVTLLFFAAIKLRIRKLGTNVGLFIFFVVAVGVPSGVLYGIDRTLVHGRISAVEISRWQMEGVPGVVWQFRGGKITINGAPAGTYDYTDGYESMWLYGGNNRNIFRPDAIYSITHSADVMTLRGRDGVFRFVRLN